MYVLSVTVLFRDSCLNLLPSESHILTSFCFKYVFCLIMWSLITWDIFQALYQVEFATNACITLRAKTASSASRISTEIRIDQLLIHMFVYHANVTRLLYFLSLVCLSLLDQFSWDIMCFADWFVEWWNLWGRRRSRTRSCCWQMLLQIQCRRPLASS